MTPDCSTRSASETEVIMKDVKSILVAVDFSASSACAFQQASRIAARTGATLRAQHVIDAGLIAAAQHIEHYEMAGYGCARTYARQLGYAEQADLLGPEPDDADGAERTARIHDPLGRSRCDGDSGRVVDRAGPKVPAVEVAADKDGCEGRVCPG